jgi:hypothetical protein
VGRLSFEVGLEDLPENFAVTGITPVAMRE